ncbi:hypothetical protein Tco_0911986 [Tanacetum coccineum]
MSYCSTAVEVLVIRGLREVEVEACASFVRHFKGCVSCVRAMPKLIIAIHLLFASFESITAIEMLGEGVKRGRTTREGFLGSVGGKKGYKKLGVTGKGLVKVDSKNNVVDILSKGLGSFQHGLLTKKLESSIMESELLRRENKTDEREIHVEKDQVPKMKDHFESLADKDSGAVGGISETRKEKIHDTTQSMHQKESEYKGPSLEEISKLRGTAQQNSMNAILAAEEKYRKAKDMGT